MGNTPPSQESRRYADNKYYWGNCEDYEIQQDIHHHQSVLYNIDTAIFAENVGSDKKSSPTE